MSPLNRDILFVICLPVGFYIGNLLIHPILWGEPPTLGGAALGTTVGLTLLFLFSPFWRGICARVWHGFMNYISFDVDIDMSKKVDTKREKNDLERNPLDDD